MRGSTLRERRRDVVAFERVGGTRLRQAKGKAPAAAGHGANANRGLADGILA